MHLSRHTKGNCWGPYGTAAALIFKGHYNCEHHRSILKISINNSSKCRRPYIWCCKVHRNNSDTHKLGYLTKQCEPSFIFILPPAPNFFVLSAFSLTGWELFFDSDAYAQWSRCFHRVLIICLGPAAAGPTSRPRTFWSSCPFFFFLSNIYRDLEQNVANSKIRRIFKSPFPSLDKLWRMYMMSKTWTETRVVLPSEGEKRPFSYPTPESVDRKGFHRPEGSVLSSNVKSFFLQIFSFFFANT